MKTALVAGATGLVGNQLLQLLLADGYYSRVIAISRKPLNISHATLENVVVDFDRLTEYHDKLKADDVFCCLGTTIKTAKTKEAFRKVDFDYPVELARIVHANGAQQFLLVSALGADKNASVFYNRVKGEVETAVESMGFKVCYIFRPSLLLGSRSEHRSGEEAAKTFFKLFGFLVPAKYKGIEAVKVARAMMAEAKFEKRGKHILESKALQGY